MTSRKILSYIGKLFLGAVFLGYIFLLCLEAYRVYPFVDEENFQLNVRHFAIFRTFIPIYVDYPTFYSYLISLPSFLTYFIVFLIKGFPLDKIFDPLFFELTQMSSSNIFLFITRFISIIFGVMTIGYVWRISLKKFNRITAFLATLFLILEPTDYFFKYSRWSLPDIVVTFFALCTFVNLFLFLKDNNLKFLRRACIFTGIAMASKLSGAFLIPVIWYAALRSSRGVNKDFVKLLIKISIYIFVYFIICTPAIVFNPQAYLPGFFKESYILLGERRHFWNIVPILSLVGKHPFWGLFAVLSVVYTAIKSTPWNRLAFFTILTGVVVWGFLSKNSVEYLLFLYPVVAIQMAQMVTDLMNFKANRIYKAGIIFCIVLVLFSGINQFVINRLSCSKKDNRVLAKEWVYKNIPKGSGFLLDWAYNPPLLPKRNVETEYLFKTQDKLKQLYDKYEKDDHGFHAINVGLLVPDLNHKIYSTCNYFFTADKCFKRYLSKSREVILDKNYENRTKFYENVINNKTKFRLLKIFAQGSGPTVYLFKRIP